MRRFVLCIALCLLPHAALAAAWTAQMEEDEGGPVMVASVTGEADGDLQPMLRMMCAGSDGINLRYEMASDAGSPGSEADFRFENEHDEATLHMVYEDMDGAFAGYFPPTDPMIALLQNGKDVFISETAGNYPAQSFSLKGSTKAITALLKTCR
jgi:hypothetical protein